MPSPIDGCRVFIKSYGCQMNVYDSQKMSDMLVARGCTLVEGYDQADIVILNTCSIREKAEDKLFSDLGRIRPYKEIAEQEGRHYIIAVTGCIAQQRKDDILKKAPCVDIILGPQMVQNIVPCIMERLNSNTPLKALVKFASEEKFNTFGSNYISHGVSGFVTIQEGCDNFCTYCIVPHTRGREVSRPVEEVIREIKALVELGTKEIILLGQNVNSYRGVDSAGKSYSLAALINKIAADVPGLKRLRYTTSHPKDVTDELIEAHRDVDILMPFVHLPVQAGSDRILAEMNRKYTVEEYLDVIDRFRKARPDMAFSSDFIVGFPGETESDFQATIEVVKTVKYAQAYSFKYSPRPYTKAATMPDQILEAIKEQRLAILQDLLNSQQNEYNQASVGMTTDVLFEKKGKYANQLVGKTPYFQAISVEVENNDAVTVGDIVQVKVIENLSHSLSGRIINAI